MNNLSNKLEDASILTRSLESLLRNLIKLLVGKISLVKIQELVRYIFIEEVENKLRNENPSKAVSLTQMALLSGLDTRTLSKIRNSPTFRTPFHTKTQFLKDSVPGASIIDYWKSNPLYLEESTQETKPIPISGPAPSFEALFQASTKSRGVTYTSLLKRLEESGTLKLNSDNSSVELVSNTYLPSDAEDTTGAIELGFSAIANLTATVTSNIESLSNGDERLFQRGAWTYRLAPTNRLRMRAELKALLEQTDKEARKLISRYEEPNQTGPELTAGVSLFYFEEEND